MRRPGLARFIAVCNVVVLGLAVAVVASGFDGQLPPRAEEQAQGPASPAGTSGLPVTGQQDRAPVDPSARLVDLPHHALEYLPPVPRTGVLGGDVDLDGGCAWIEMDGQALAVRWRAGYQAAIVAQAGAAEALAVVDPSGGVVAYAGEEIWFTGARSGGPERLDRCHVGDDHVWYVDAVGTDVG